MAEESAPQQHSLVVLLDDDDDDDDDAATTGDDDTFTQEECLKKFTDLAVCMFAALKDLFPECKRTLSKYRKFKTLVVPFNRMQTLVIKEWQKTVSPFYRDIQNGSLDSLIKSDIALVKEMRIAEKVADSRLADDPDSMYQLLVYICSLNTYANSYFTASMVPDNMKGVVEQMAAEMQRKMESGEPLDTMKMGLEMYNRLGPDALMQFTQNMFNTPGGLTALQTNFENFKNLSENPPRT